MTLRPRDLFLAVARARSFRRVAEQVALGQPALSPQIKELDVLPEDRTLRVLAGR